MNTINQRGGVRPNSGRKPLDDKKMPVTVYVAESVIKRIGTTKKAREIMSESLIISANLKRKAKVVKTL